MAASVTAPNLQRFALPEIEISSDSNGIISIIDDLVERVMSVHMKKSGATFLSSTSPQEEIASLLSLHSVYDFRQDDEDVEAA